MYLSFKGFDEGLTGGTVWSVFSVMLVHAGRVINTGGRGGTMRRLGSGSEILRPAQSKAMSLGDLEKIYAYSLKQCPEGMVPRTAEDITLMTRHLFWRAFSAFGFVIVMRIGTLRRRTSGMAGWIFLDTNGRSIAPTRLSNSRSSE